MLRPLWSITLGNSPRGVGSIDEVSFVYVWDNQILQVWNAEGRLQGTVPAPGKLAAVSAAMTGQAYVWAGADGFVGRLNAALQPLWQYDTGRSLQAIALDPTGIACAVADTVGTIQLLDAQAKTIRKFQAPRPAQYLVFHPGKPLLLVAADSAFVGVYDLQRNDWCWRDVPVLSFGSLAIAGWGDVILLACFSEGVRLYDSQGHLLGFSGKPTSAHSAALSADAKNLVIACREPLLTGYRRDGTNLFHHHLTNRPLSVALHGLGTTAYIIQADKTLVAFDLQRVL